LFKDSVNNASYRKMSCRNATSNSGYTILLYTHTSKFQQYLASHAGRCAFTLYMVYQDGT
jgi:hypothetical protein